MLEVGLHLPAVRAYGSTALRAPEDGLGRVDAEIAQSDGRLDGDQALRKLRRHPSRIVSLATADGITGGRLEGPLTATVGGPCTAHVCQTSRNLR